MKKKNVKIVGDVQAGLVIGNKWKRSQVNPFHLSPESDVYIGMERV